MDIEKTIPDLFTVSKRYGDRKRNMENRFDTLVVLNVKVEHEGMKMK